MGIIKDGLNTRIFSIKSRSTQVSLMVGLLFAILNFSSTTTDLVMLIGYLVGSIVTYSVIAYIFVAPLFWIVMKIKKK